MPLNEIESQRVLGHKKIESILANAIRSKRVFPTWIFSGPPGVGKSMMADKFARCLLSDTIPSGNFLDVPLQHPVHRLVDMRTHPDLFVLENQADTVASIDDTRQLMAKFRKKPTLSRWRVVLLKGAENLNKNIHNSLLKILEEPPANSVIIMTCSHVGSMPKTLLSRSARINFRPLETELVQSYLEKIGTPNPGKLAKLSGGSIGYALQLQHNDGTAVREMLEHIFQSDQLDDVTCKNIGHLMDTYAATHFSIIKESILQIMGSYVSMLVDKTPASTVLDIKILKIMDIISMLNKEQRFMLDRDVVLAYIFERFFSIP
ncbi:MAG: NACHT domain-containing protein [Holosporaceae bacterium]|jgi:DNA polymerase-3 subunit delta'|nr:NACHT domain-containing protein [Holosporaceae bacterium]